MFLYAEISHVSVERNLGDVSPRDICLAAISLGDVSRRRISEMYLGDISRRYLSAMYLAAISLGDVSRRSLGEVGHERGLLGLLELEHARIEECVPDRYRR